MSLFLDFDGVLHPEPAPTRHYLCRLPLLEELLMDYELLEYAIRDAGLWAQVREVVIPRNVDAITGELAAEECYRSLRTRGLGRHHALADALALRAAYLVNLLRFRLGPNQVEF